MKVYGVQHNQSASIPQSMVESRKSLEVNRIICDDCVEEMRKMPSKSIDTIITDPPYGLEFMGKDWDKFGISEMRAKRLSGGDFYRKMGKPDRFFNYREGCQSRGRYTEMTSDEKFAFQKFIYHWAVEALRVCKPGAIILIFGGTRTYHRLACAIEDAGWQIRDCMMWLYGSGFPKSLNIGQVFDHQACQEQLQKELGRKPTREEFKAAWKSFRMIIGENPNVRPNCNPEDNTLYKYGATGKTGGITTPTTDLARLWDGYGTALKPAWEPIVVAMKPLDGTFAANAEKWGVAGLNIDGGRIGINIDNEPDTGDSYYLKRGKPYPNQGKSSSKIMGTKSERVDITMKQGRWPANLILDEEAGAMLDKQAPANSQGHWAKTKVTGFGKFGGGEAEYKGVGRKAPKGLQGASRFFYCPKTSKRERNLGLEGMPKKLQNRMRPDKGEPTGLNKEPRWAPKLSQNNHPTVKPLALMKYLCGLLKMPGDKQIILDPFAGSGTTCIACALLGINYIGIEREKEYCEIAERRIAGWVSSVEDANGIQRQEKNNTRL